MVIALRIMGIRPPAEHLIRTIGRDAGKQKTGIIDH